VLELFICKTEIKIYFERWLFHVNNWQWVLAIFHTKQVRAVPSSLKNWHIGALLYSLALLPTFSFLKPWLTNSIRFPPTFTYHGGVPFFFSVLLEYNGLTSSLAKLMTSR
jgi:hypothetical protein